ncbi:MAG: dihydrolipoamide acetyltransferase family protein, partial [Thermoanaerobaculia bacterium]
MAEIIMPKMGDAMTEGKVVRWYKKAGEPVKKGEPLLEIETDKVNLDLEAEQDGTLGNLAVQEGQMAAVGSVLASILGAGEKDSPAATQKQKAEEPVQRRATDKKDSVKHTTGEYGEAIEMRGPRIDRTSPQGNVIAMPKGNGGRRRSSPLARKMASELGVSLDSLQGSGPGGRIIAKDVQGAKKQGGAPAPSPALRPAEALQSKEIPLTAMRRTIAKRLAESTGPIPHFYLTADFDVVNLLSLRLQINDISGIKTSLNDFIVRAVALALRHHPYVNSSWGEEAISQHGDVHIGIAVSTPEGLITPVVRNADQKSVEEINAEVRTLAEKAKNRKLMPNEYQGSTFTISNLGAWGIEEFT